MSSQSSKRELLTAGNIGWWSDAWVGNLFQECPWKHPPLIAFAAELNRDASHHSVSLVESWAPAGLIPIGMLVANDAESVLSALAELKSCEIGKSHFESVLRDLWEQSHETEELHFFRSDEVSIRRSCSEDLADLLKVDRYSPILLVRRVYYDQQHHPVLAQELRSPADQETLPPRRRPSPRSSAISPTGTRLGARWGPGPECR